MSVDEGGDDGGLTTGGGCAFMGAGWTTVVGFALSELISSPLLIYLFYDAVKTPATWH